MATRNIKVNVGGKQDTRHVHQAGRVVATFADQTVGHFRRVSSAVFNLRNLIGGLVAAGAAKSIFAPAIEMETFETQFTTLLGSLDAAKARMKDLAVFAAATPFELPELAQASRILQTLTGGALAAGNELRMIGDVAASVNAPVGELATWFGRLYDGIQSGRPVGEAMMRLQELGVISGGVRRKIEDLQAAGKQGPEVWLAVTKAMAQYAGGMDRLSQTTAGKLSTLRDNWKAVRQEVGDAAIPALKTAIDSLLLEIEKLKASGNLT